MSTPEVVSVCPICSSPDVVHLCAAVMEANAMQSRNEIKKQTDIESEPVEKSVEVTDVVEPHAEKRTTDKATHNGSSEHENNDEDSNCPKFVVIYLGSSTLDRRFPPKSAMTWVMAEVKQSRDTFREVQLQVHKSTLVALTYEGSEAPIDTVFEHNLHSLSRFAKTHQDPRCFAYLRRQSLYSDFECHVFLAHDEKVVPELFHCIRGATQRDIFEEMEPRLPDTTKACYEVMYVGRAKVKGKKILSSHIDDLVMRLETKDNKNSNPDDNGTELTDRRRHKSDSSVKSLPSILDSGLVKENELQKVSQNTIFQGVELHNESHGGSHDDVHKDGSSELLGNQHSDSTDHLSDGGHSSSENVTDTLQTSNSSDMLKDMIHGFHHPDGHGHVLGQDDHGNQRSTNRTMLFRIGQNDISLISLDKKQTLIERKFKNISSVSQGNLKPDVFGFISREPGSHLLCHLLRCYSNDVVDEIMGTLKTSFQSAYQQSRLQTQQICINCPLHQYHKLCQDINGLQPEAAYNVLCKRIQNLPEKDADDLYHSLQNGNPQCHEESVEALMIAIRKLCEHKQREHTHISDSNKGSHKPDICLMEIKDKSNKSAFDFLRDRAKKKLTSSFETLFTNVHTKTEEVKEAFRHRSGTNESEGGSFSRSVDYASDASPAPSPAFHTKDQSNFEFPSPPASPSSRPRSSTVGALPDVNTVERVKARQERRQEAEKKEQEKRRLSESPMKHMFILANTGSPVRRSSGNSSHGSEDGDDFHPENYTPVRRGSWRQAIFNRVVTPAKNPQTPTLDECEEINDGEQTNKKSSEELRALWRKAILETLLLIRMEKENQDLQGELLRLNAELVDYSP